MTRTNSNTAPEAVEAAAERRLASIKAERVAKADAKLAEAKNRLAQAQATAEQAASNLAVHEWQGNRQRVLEAEQECVLANSLVANAERALTRSKARTTPEEKQAAIDLVTAERARSALVGDLEPHLAKIREASASIIEGMRAVLERIGDYSHDSLTMRDALDALGIPYNEEMVLAQPSASGHVSGAVAQACRSAGFSPLDFKTLVAPHTVAAPEMPLPGAQVGKLPTAEEEAEHLRQVNRNFRNRMIEEGERNSRQLTEVYARRAGDP